MRARPSLYCFGCCIGNGAKLIAAAFALSLAGVSFSLPARASAVDHGIVDGVGIEEHLGARVSIEKLKLRDETGRTVPLSTYFHPGRPVILSLVYYECPNLCTVALNGLTDSLKALDWTAGKRFDIVVVSINPKETPELAASKKAAYVGSYGREGAGAGWHFLTGEQSEVRELASELGFHYRYDKETKQFAHSSAIYVMTPQGKITRYLYGIAYRTMDLRMALLEATHGRIGSFLDRVLSLCYRYDPVRRHYVASEKRIAALGAGAGGTGTVLFFGGFLAVLRRREKEKGKV